MNSYLFKIKHTIPYCLIVTTVAAVVYGLLRWIITFVLEITVIKSEVWAAYLPCVLGLVVFWFSLRKRFWIIRESIGRQGDWRWMLQFAQLLSLISMMYLAQSYVATHLMQLQSVDNITQVDPKGPNVYYDIQEFGVRHSTIRRYIESRTIPRRYSSDLRFSMYAVFQFSEAQNVWYGLKHSETAHRSNDNVLQRDYQEFIDSCNSMIASHDFGRYSSFKRSVPSDDHDGFVRAVISQSEGEVNKSDIVILTPMTDGYVDDNGNTLIWVLRVLGIWLALMLLLLVKAPINDKLLTKQLTLRKTKPKNGNDSSDLLRTMFIPDRKNWPLTLIFDAIILYFVTMTLCGVNPMTPSSEEIYEWGALRGYSLHNGEWWRVITSMFMHGNIVHLIANLVSFGLVTLFAVGIFGYHRLAAIFMVSGICGAVAAASLFEGTYVGASGGIMGLMGATMICYVRYDCSVIPHDGKWWVILTTFFTLLLGISSGVSNTAHIIGLVIGATLGMVLFKAPPAKRRRISKKGPTNQPITELVEMGESDGQDIIIHHSMLKNVLLSIGSMAMAAGAVFILIHSSDPIKITISICGCLFFGVGSVVMLVSLSRQKSVLVIRTDGFQYKESLSTLRFVSWGEVDSISLWTIRGGDIICVSVKNRELFESRLPKRHRIMSRAFSSLPPIQIPASMVNSSAIQMVQLMTERMERYNEALK